MTKKNPIRVLHLRSSNFYGGPERQIHFHARHATSEGVDITISSFSENEKIPDFLAQISNDNIDTKLFDVKNAYDTSTVGLIREYLNDQKVDILCTHEYRSHFYGYMACRGSNTKWIAFSRGMTTENIKIKIFTYLEKFFLKKASHIVAVSESQKIKLINLGMRAARITTVHNAIDLSYIDSIESLSLKSKFSFEQDSFICISAGRFSEEKGQFYLVKAAEIAVKKNQKLRFILFGEGPDLPKIREYITAHKLQKYILCPGFEKNILGLIKSADLLINPSLSEGLPNIVLEALASEIPVIATRVGGHPEIITDGLNGYLVDAKDVIALSEKILLLSENRKTVSDFVEESHRVLNDKFTFISQNEKLIKLYNDEV